MLIRGQDVIEDEQRLKKIAAHELGIHPAEYTVATYRNHRNAARRPTIY
jgi:hypothetical protein